MPKWEKMTVGDLCDTISDTYRGDDKDVVLINTSDVLEGKVLNHQVVENKNLKGQFKKTFKENDILYSEIRPANKRYAFVDFGDTDNYIASTKLMVLRPRKDVVRPRFLFSFLASKSVLEELQQLAETRSGTFPQITFSSELAPTPINVPDLETQDRIVGILDGIEGKISTNAEINKNLYQQVVALYSSLFGKPTQQTSSVGQYSEQIYSGGTPSTSKSEYWNGEFHWFSSGETRNRFAITTDKTITKTGVDNSSTKLAHKYDIVMASAGQGFTRGQTTMLLLDTYVNQSVIVIHANHTVLPYLFWNLAGRYDELRAISDSSSIRGSLTTKMIAGFVIPEVDSESLAEFSEFAWPVISEIENNLLENQRLSTLRDTLLPRLMSGEIDVSDIDL